MKIKFLITGLLVCLSIIVQAQTTDCDDLKKENEYLRNALNILKPVQSATSSKVELSLIKCEGNSVDQTVTLWLTATNKEANKDFQFSQSEVIDVEGNSLKSYDIVMGSSGIRGTLYTDVPVKVSVTFKKVLPSVKILKLINLEHYNPQQAGRTLSFQFKDININWE